MHIYLIVAGVMLMLAPAAGAAQEDPAVRVRAAMDRAAAAGIPTSLLQSRVDEGRAKRIPMERIAAAVERRGIALARARDAMAGAARLTEADLAAGADAVEAGIRGDALRAIIEQARAEDRPVAIAVLTFLHREQGLPVDQALARVSEALGRGPEALRSLPAQAAAAVGRRGPPAGVGRGGPPAGIGTGGPPSGVPGPGAKPGGGKPDGVGNPRGRGGRPTDG